MEERLVTRIEPAKVWAFWERKIQSGANGDTPFRYQIFDIKKGEGFSILWKSLFVHLIFTHSVKPVSLGSEICYGVRVKGFFGLPIRWFLKKRLQANLSVVLKSVVQQLEQ
jgi:hypothetical protein